MSKPKLSNKNIEKSPRAFAINIVMQCNRGSYANDILPSALTNSVYSDSDKSLITKIVYSTLRNQLRIDNALKKVSSKSLEQLDEVALSALRTVGAQLLLDMADHAVANETVKVMPISIKGFVNAVTRKMIDLNNEKQLFIDETDSVRYSLPNWIYKEIEDVFLDKTTEVAHALNVPAQVTLAPLVGSLPIENDSFQHGSIVENSLLISSQGSISELDLVKQGKAIVVDQGSQVVVQCVEAKKEDSVLDLCAAPGGKSFLISQTAAKVTSADVSASRMKKFFETKERIGADNVYPLIADAKNMVFSENFDKILLDAPCSGLGVLRRRPDARLRILKDDVLSLSELQKELLKSAIALMSPDTELIYSVCTFTREETLEIDRWLEKEHPELVAIDLSGVNKHLEKLGRGFLLPPGEENDGMYVIKLCKQ